MIGIFVGNIRSKINYYIFQSVFEPAKPGGKTASRPASTHENVQEKTTPNKASKGRKNKAAKVEEEEKINEVGQKESLTKQNSSATPAPPPTKGKGAEKEMKQRKGKGKKESGKKPPAVPEPVPVKSSENVQDPAKDPTKSGSVQGKSRESIKDRDGKDPLKSKSTLSKSGEGAKDRKDSRKLSDTSSQGPSTGSGSENERKDSR